MKYVKILWFFHLEPGLFANLEKHVFYRGLRVSFDFGEKTDSYINMGSKNEKSKFFYFSTSFETKEGFVKILNQEKKN